MVRYREILRLRNGGVSIRNIAYSCGCSKSTVQTVLKKAKASGLCWPLPEEIGDTEIYDILFPKERVVSAKAEPDFEQVHKELARKGVTLTLCWNEYCEAALAEGTEPYQYSAFCRRYTSWAELNKTVMHIRRRPAEQMMVDWCGATMEVVDRDTGETHKVYVFVACLAYSSYLYAEGFFRMDETAWLTAHVNAFEHFGGTTPIVVPDNLKTGIVKNTVDELIVNESYRRLGEYYGFAALPARVRKPRDKAAVESGVGVVTRSAIAPLRDRVFFSLPELNRALAQKVADISSRPFQKREGSRESVFFMQERDALLPLPQKRFEVYTSKTVRVPYNYHISVESVFYSVPHTHVKQEVEVRVTASTVSVYAGTSRIAMHKRSHACRGSYVTNPTHMPDAHRDFAEWTGDRFRRWATAKGASVAGVVDAILASKPIEQQTYRSARALMSLADKYGDQALDDACARALSITRQPSYKTVKTIIAKHNANEAEQNTSGNEFAYLRGAAYFDATSTEG